MSWPGPSIQDRPIHTRKHESGLRKSHWSGVFCWRALFIQVCEIGSACFRCTDEAVTPWMSGNVWQASISWIRKKPAHATFSGFQNIFFSQCFLSVRNIHRVFANFPTRWRFWIICWSEFLSIRIYSLVDVTHFSLFDIRESTAARFTDKPCGIRH